MPLAVWLQARQKEEGRGGGRGGVDSGGAGCASLLSHSVAWSAAASGCRRPGVACGILTCFSAVHIGLRCGHLAFAPCFSAEDPVRWVRLDPAGEQLIDFKLLQASRVLYFVKKRPARGLVTWAAAAHPASAARSIAERTAKRHCARCTARCCAILLRLRMCHPHCLPAYLATLCLPASPPAAGAAAGGAAAALKGRGGAGGGDTGGHWHACV